MRRPLALLLLAAGVLLALPPSLGQVPPLVELTLEEPPIVPPLQGARVANATLRVSCALVDATGGVPIAYEIVEVPAWAVAVVSPVTDRVDATACDAGYATRVATVTVTVTDQAPARSPAPLTLRATAGSARGEQAEATANVTASYFPLVDLSPGETVKTAPPGSVVPFQVKFTNLGNGPTRIVIARDEADLATGTNAALTLEPVEAFTLGSRQAGDADTSRTLDVLVRTGSKGGFVNEVGVVNLLVHVQDAGTNQTADTLNAAFLVTTRSPILETPAPPLGLLAPALVLAALVAAARHASKRD